MIVMKSVWSKFDVWHCFPCVQLSRSLFNVKRYEYIFNLFPGLYIAGSCDMTPMCEWSLEKVIVTYVFDLDKNISQSSI